MIPTPIRQVLSTIRTHQVQALVETHYRATGAEPAPERIHFRLTEARGPERLVELVRRFPGEARAVTEARAEQDKDRAYWEPLKRELESFGRTEARERRDPRTG